MRLNINPYVIPTPVWMFASFPIGRRKVRHIEGSMDGVFNIGLTHNLGGAFADRNVFCELTGGPKVVGRRIRTAASTA